MNIILASTSPRRKELLSQIVPSFSIQTTEVDERNDKVGDPKAIVELNALNKANPIAKKNPQALVLGSDTVVCLGNRIFHKPNSIQEAQGMLLTLSGKTHSVYTGVALLQIERGYSHNVAIKSEVTFKRLDTVTISEYYSRINPLDKAGGYAIQEHSDLILESYSGEYENIIGLPIQYLQPIIDSLL